MSGIVTMRAAVFSGPGTLSLEFRPVPRIEAADDVLVEIDVCGVCGSDLQILAVPPGHPARVGVILGHEICGHVVDAGPQATVDASNGLVVVDPDVKCGFCAPCQDGRPSLCSNLIAMGVDADGGFAAYCRVPARNVFPIARSVPPTVAALAEPLATVLHGVRQLNARLGERGLIFGAGPIGCLFLRTLHASGIRPVWVIDPVPSRRAAAELLGADDTASSALEFADAVRSGRAAAPDVIVDTAGRCLEDAVLLARRGGRVLLFGINSTAESRIRQLDITSHEISVIGSIAGSFTMLAAIQAIETGAVDLSDFTIGEVGLTQLPETIEQLRRGEILKAVVRPGG